MTGEYWFYYQTDSQAIIRVRAKHRPARTTIPARGTWVVSEWNGEKWGMATFPEITYAVLRDLTYIGKVKCPLKNSPPPSPTS